MSRSLCLSALLVSLCTPSILVAAVSLSSVLSDNNLGAVSFNYSVPSTALDSADATNYIIQNWRLYNSKPDFGSSDIVFSPDPSISASTIAKRATNATTTTKTSTTKTPTYTTTTYPTSSDLGTLPPVLRVEYPAGSYSKSTGGTQFYSQPLNGTSSTGTSYERMLLSYDVYFPSNYSWNIGGKLPGLRGGPDPRGCSGGSQTDGSTCFSTRLMWRTNGAGEVYAYIPSNSTSGFCSSTNVICNSDFGTSLSRGSFTFATGQWQTIWLVVILNTVGTANGVVQLYYNGVQAMSFSNLNLRSSSSIASIGGLYFSTFFGGDDSSWASPTDQFTYFKNIALYAGNGQATGTGASVPVVSVNGTNGSSGSPISGAVSRTVGGGWLSLVMLLLGLAVLI